MHGRVSYKTVATYKSALLKQQILHGYNAAQENHSCFNARKRHFLKYKLYMHQAYLIVSNTTYLHTYVVAFQYSLIIIYKLMNNSLLALDVINIYNRNPDDVIVSNLWSLTITDQRK